MRHSSFLLVVLTATVLGHGSADAATRHASPTGSGTTCTLVAPCSIETAFSGSAAGDVLELAGGTYATSTALRDDGGAITVRTASGQGAARIDSTAPEPMALFNTGSSVSDIDLRGGAASSPVLALFSASASRVRVIAADAPFAVACKALLGTSSNPTSLFDTACVAPGTDATAIDTRTNGAFSNGDNVLRLTRVTARASGSGGDALDGASIAARPLDIEAVDTILDATGTDVILDQAGAPLTATFTRSNRDTPVTTGAPTIVDGGGNQTAEPIWDATTADPIIPTLTSPTVDAGATTTADTLQDVDRRVRYAGAASDLGAVELTPPGSVGSVAVSAVTATTATFTATVDTRRAHEAIARFAYTTGSTSVLSPDQATTRQDGNQSVTTTVTGLLPATSYTVSGQLAGGAPLVNGPTATFTTPAAPAGPTGPSGPAGPSSPTGPSGPTALRAPRLTGVGLAAVRRGRTARLTLTSDRAAGGTLVLERIATGRRSGTRCVAKGRGRRCTRYVKLSTKPAAVAAGRNRIAISTRTAAGARRPAGRYRVTLTLAQAGGPATTVRRTLTVRR